jgi:O-antigen/teichoic acid export membrane protein
MSRMMLSSLLSTTYLNLDKIIISKLLSVAALGYYSVAQKVVRKGSMIPRAISQAAYPNLSSIHIRNNEDDLIYQYRKLQDLICYGLVVIYGIIIFAFLPLFSYMLNEEVARTLLVPTILLCLGSYMLSTGLIPFYVALAMGKPEIGMRTNFYILVINIPITVFLIYFYGLVGAGLSFVSARCIAYLYGIRRTCRECLDIPVSEWYVHILRIVILAAATYGIAWSVIAFMGSYTLTNLAIGCLISTVGFLIGSFYMIGDELRRSLFSHFESLRKGFVQTKGIGR